MQIKWIVDNIRAFSFVLTNWNKEPDKDRIYRWGEFFHELDNTRWKMRTGARATKQNYISCLLYTSDAADEEEIYRWTEFFHKLDNKKWKMRTGARATKQNYISIYISLSMETFLKTGVYIYIWLDLVWFFLFFFSSLLFIYIYI